MTENHRQGVLPLLGRNDTRGQRGQIEPETLQAHMPGGESEKVLHTRGNRSNNSSWCAGIGFWIQKEEEEQKSRLKSGGQEKGVQRHSDWLIDWLMTDWLEYHQIAVVTFVNYRDMNICWGGPDKRTRLNTF